MNDIDEALAKAEKTYAKAFDKIIACAREYEAEAREILAKAYKALDKAKFEALKQKD